MQILKIIFLVVFLTFTFLNTYSSELDFEELQNLNAHPAPFFSVDISCDGYIATASFYNNTIRIYKKNNESFKRVQNIETYFYSYPICVKFSPDGNFLASGNSVGDISIWDKESNWGSNAKFDQHLESPIQSLYAQPKTDIRELKTKYILDIDFSPDGEYLVAAGSEKNLKFWRKENNEYVESQSIPDCHYNDIRDLDFNSNGNYLASAGDDGVINIWQKENEKFTLFQKINTDSKEMRCVSFSNDDRYLLAGDSQGNLHCWKFENNNFLISQKIKVHSGKINRISLNSSNNIFAVASSDNTISIWKLVNEKLSKQNKLFKHNNIITSISFNKAGNLLASVDIDGLINIWKLENDKISFDQNIDDNFFKINSLSFHPNGKLIASAGEDRYIKIWEIQNDNLNEFQKIKISKKPIKELSFSPDGNYLISLEDIKGLINIWKKDGNKYTESDIFYEDVGNNNCFSFSKFNNYFALGYSSGVEIYNYTRNDFDKIYNLAYEVDTENYNNAVRDISFDSDGNILAIAQAKKILLWDRNTKEYIQEIIITDSIYSEIDKIDFSIESNYLFVKLDLSLNFGIGKQLKIYRKSNDKYYELQTTGIMYSFDTIIGLSPLEDYFVLGYYNGSIIVMKKDISEFEPQINESVKPDTISYGKKSDETINLTFSPDGEYLVCTTESGLLRFFQISGLIIPIDQFVRIKLASFLEKDEYETTNEYNNRIKKYLDYKTQEIVNYALEIGYKLKIESISSYNADKKTYLINFQNCNQANAFVPRKFAKDFKENFKKLEVRNPQIKFVNDNLLIAYAEIINPENNRTFIVGEKSFFHEIEISNNDIENDNFYSVDIDIPISKEKKENSLAVIIGIENYRNISNVNYAYRDASYINEYFNKTIGIPKEQIYLKTNEEATLGEFNKIFSANGWLEKRIEKNETDIYVYYAGHGAPAIKEKEAFLIPFDGDPNYPIQTGYSLETMFQNLNNLNAKSVTIFLDACFTGANRENEMLLANARPVSIELKNNYVKNITVLSATSNNEISSSYPKARHGLFSYFLMKGMQGEADTNKDDKLTINELFDYTKKNVSRIAGTLDREQTPQLECLEPEKIIINFKD